MPKTSNFAAAAAVLALAFFALAGCGPFGGAKSAEDQARDTLTELIAARNQRDFGKVCGLITPELLNELKRRSHDTCARTLAKAVPADTTITIRIDQVRVSGDRATVDATVSTQGGAGNARTILLQKEGGDWKVSKVNF